MPDLSFLRLVQTDLKAFPHPGQKEQVKVVASEY